MTRAAAWRRLIGALRRFGRLDPPRHRLTACEAQFAARLGLDRAYRR